MIALEQVRKRGEDVEQIVFPVFLCGAEGTHGVEHLILFQIPHILAQKFHVRDIQPFRQFLGGGDGVAGTVHRSEMRGGEHAGHKAGDNAAVAADIQHFTAEFRLILFQPVGQDRIKFTVVDAGISIACAWLLVFGIIKTLVSDQAVHFAKIHHGTVLADGILHDIVHFIVVMGCFEVQFLHQFRNDLFNIHSVSLRVMQWTYSKTNPVKWQPQRTEKCLR